MCVKLVSFSVLNNGEPKGRIIPTKGLWQGNPISPYLFLLCAKGLSAMLRREASMGRIKGISVYRRAPQISHLLFTDDCIIFCKATREEGNRVMKIIKDYEVNSGQKLKKEKTFLFFSKNTSRETQEDVKNLFGAQIMQRHERYLVLPPMMDRGRKKALSRIKDQVGRRIASWKGKLLSNAGREILIKAMAQATPTYMMSGFLLPDSLCSELNSLVRNFWWGQKEKERKLAWVSWEKLCNRKTKGLRAFNLALLAKQGWRILKNLNSLLHSVFKVKYFAKVSFMDAQLGRNPSYVWRSVVAARDTIDKGLRWNVGNGKKVNIWNDRCLPTADSFKRVSPRNQEVRLEKVEQLIDFD